MDLELNQTIESLPTEERIEQIREKIEEILDEIFQLLQPTKDLKRRFIFLKAYSILYKSGYFEERKGNEDQKDQNKKMTHMALAYSYTILNQKLEEGERLEILNWLGEMEFKNQKYAAAEMIYTQLCDLQPDNMEAWCSLGLCFMEMGELHSYKALKIFRQVLHLNPNHQKAKESLKRLTQEGI